MFFNGKLLTVKTEPLSVNFRDRHRAQLQEKSTNIACYDKVGTKEIK